MPIYEYECFDNKHRFEQRQGFDDDPVDVCPECNGRMKRIIHSAAVIYKGSGFYTTDYARAGDTSQGEKSSSNQDSSDDTQAGED